MIAIAIGILTAVLVAVSGKITKFDKDRSFYPTVLIVIASYYLLFGVIGEEVNVIFYELCVIAIFLLLAVIGAFKFPFVIGLSLVAHGVFDLVHELYTLNKGMPVWWPLYCAAVDIPLGIWVLFLNNSGGLNRPTKVE